ncbi:hypothetical protein [Pseudomonas sp. REB1044]|uniref:hypothetical protein n=1 Tax=Pseudomonas sp. REB1044 TaxID=2675224 RepID=UPI00315D636F
MINLNTSNITSNPPAKADTPEKKLYNYTAEDEETKKTERLSISVDISNLSIEKLKKENEENKDIDESGLPEATKEILKNIRRIKKQIEEKQAELRAIEQDGTLDPQTRMIKIQGAQAAIKTLQGMLTEATGALAKQMKHGLSADQALKAGSLAMK